MRVLNFGSLNLDHTYTLDHFVQPAETTNALEYHTYFGGKGHNQSIALAKAGVDTWHAGLVGKDGADLLQQMKKNGVRVDYTEITDAATGHAIIQVDKHGQNSIIVYSGANGMVDTPFVEKVLQHFEKGDTLLLQNEISSIPIAMETAKKRGMKIIFNPSPCTPEIQEYPLELVDIFVVNEVEGEALSGKQKPEDILDILHKKYPSAEILLTLGKDGAIFSSAQGRIFQPVYPSHVVDTTGAGDTFTGYFFSWYLNGEHPKSALSAAAMASSIAVSRPGAAVSIPARKEVVTRLQEQHDKAE